LHRINIDSEHFSYDLYLGRGLLAELKNELASYSMPGMLICDGNLAKAWQQHLEELLANFEIQRLILRAGEETKNSASLLEILSGMQTAGLNRKSPLIAFGGGVIGDMSGLAASLYMRGISVIQCPTSLLAMLDASVGGKTAINYGGLRNQIGTFWPPKAVFADIDMLKTLPEEEFICGIGELLKMSWLADGQWANEVEANLPDLLNYASPFLEDQILRAIQFKAKIVAEDERDNGVRNLLNLGHSFAHAMESLAPGELKHGQAVIFGMLAAVEASRLTKTCDSRTAKDMALRLQSVIKRLNLQLPDRVKEPALLLNAIRRDKKNSAGIIRLILPIEPGKATAYDLKDEQIIIESFNSILELS
jgi:3-dehydroquinate synthase